MEQQIEERIRKAIDEKVFPGCVVGMVTKTGKRTILPFGHFTYDMDSPSVQKDTVYDMASVTKMIPLACAVLWLVDQNKITLDTKIVDFIPEFATSEEKGMVTVWHLLTYTLDLDLPSMTSLKDRTAKELMDIVLTAPLKAAPGSSLLYTNSTAAITGLFVHRVTGKMIDSLADEIFFSPLHLQQTTFHPEQMDKNLIPPTEIDSWRGRTIQGEVHDESTAITQKEGYYLGVAGLFSCADDMLTFLEMLLCEGELQNVRYLSKEIVQQMHTNQLADIGQKVGLGWDLNSKNKMGDLSSDEIFGHTGFTGTLVTCDPVRGVGIVIFSNRTYPHRPIGGDAINAVRHDVSDIIFANL